MKGFFISKIMAIKGFITLAPGGNVVILSLSVIYKFSYQAIAFVRIDWKSLPRTNTLAYNKKS